MFTQRHYIAIALLILRLPARPSKATLIKELCRFFKSDNSKFKEHLFVKACTNG